MGYTLRIIALSLTTVLSAAGSAQAQTNLWRAAANGNWSNPNNWTLGVVPATNHDVGILVPGTYTVTLDVNADVASVTIGGNSGTQTLRIASARSLTVALSSTVGARGVIDLDGNGTLQGTGNLTVNGQLNWAGGGFGRLQGSGALIIGTGGVFNVAAPSNDAQFLLRALTMNGTMNLAGPLHKEGGFTINGTMNWSNGRFSGVGAAVVGTAGRLAVTGTNTFKELALPLTVDGTLDMLEGEVRGNGAITVNGTMNWQDWNVGGTGTLLIASGGRLIARGTSYLNRALTVNGTFDWNGVVISGSGNITVNGTMNWERGNIGGDGSFTIARAVRQTGRLTVSGSGGNLERPLQVDGVLAFAGGSLNGAAPIVINGTMDWSGGTRGGTGLTTVASSGVLNVRDPGVKRNDRPLSVIGGLVMTGGDLTGSGNITVDGTMTWRAGTIGGSGQLLVNGPSDAGAGGVLVLSAAGTKSLNRALTVAHTLRLEQGEVAGSGSITVTGDLVWSGGVLGGTGPVAIQPGATATLSGASAKTLSRRLLTNRGTVSIQGSGDLLLASGASVINSGVIDFRSDAGIRPGDASRVELSNSESIVKRAGTGESNIAVPMLNIGSVGIEVGTIALSGAVQQWSGGRVTGAGRLRVRGSFSYTGGTMTGPGEIEITEAGVLNLEAGSLLIDGRTIRNRGRVALWNDHVLVLNQAFHNTGTFEIRGSGTLRPAQGTSPTFFNDGLFRSITPSGTATVQVTFLNRDHIELGGRMQFLGIYSSTGTSVISGTGELSSSAVLDLNGLISPGGSGTGTLKVAGAVRFTPNTRLRMDLGGVSPGQGYDQFQAGDTELNGVLEVVLLDGYLPGPGDAYNIGLFTSRTGDFAEVVLPELAGGGTLRPRLTETTLWLSVYVPGVTARRWRAPVSGIWHDPDRWEPVGVPTSVDSVVIRVQGTYTVTVDGHAEARMLRIGKPTAGEGVETLLVTDGGRLTVGGASVILPSGELVTSGIIDGPGSLTVDGMVRWHSGDISGVGQMHVAEGGRLVAPESVGARTLGRPLIIDGDAVLSGGSIGGSGAISVRRSMRWAGGTIAGTGPISVEHGGSLALRGPAGSTGTPLRTLDRTLTVSGTLDLIDGELVGRGDINVTGDEGRRGVMFWEGASVLGGTGQLLIGPGGILEMNDPVVRQLNRPLHVVGQMTLEGGDLLGAFPIHVPGRLSWTAGQIGGENVLSIPETGSVVWSGTGTKTLARPLVAAGRLVLVDGTVTGTGEITINGEMEWRSGRLSGTGAAIVTGTGRLYAQRDAGVDEPVMTLDRPLRVDGRFDIGADGEATLDGTGDVDVHGTLNWYEGTIAGTGRLAVSESGRFVMDLARSNGDSSGPSRRLVGRTVVNGGITLLRHDLTLSGGAAFVNRGLFDVLSHGSMDHDGDPSATFTNEGLFRFEADEGTFAIGAGFVNEGTAEIGGGVLQFRSLFHNRPAGVIRGTGVLDLERAAVTPGGTLRPGSPAGTLTIRGGLATDPETSRLALHVGHAGHGRLEVLGPAQLEGVLDVELEEGFAPALGSAFEVMRFAEGAGAFAEVNLPDPGTGRFRLEFGERSLVLLVEEMPENSPPVAVNDTLTAAPGVATVIAVLRNDYDPDGDVLRVTSVTDPFHGRVEVTSDSTVTYTSDPSFTGTDRFDYTVSDGNGATASASVIVRVEAGTGGAEDEAPLVDGFRISPAFPNPFATRTRFTLAVAHAQHVRVEVFDVAGRLVEVSHDGVLPAGQEHLLQLGGEGWGSGLFIYRVTGEAFSASGRVLLVK
jgi:hypothetical protein